jgi:hypothetical protein
MAGKPGPDATGSTKPIVRYNSHMVSSLQQAKDVEKALREEQTERAARLVAMLDRWASEDVSDDPAWDVGGIHPMTLRSSGGPNEPTELPDGPSCFPVNDDFDPLERARLLQAIDDGIGDFERGAHMDGFDFIAQMRSRREASNR